VFDILLLATPGATEDLGLWFLDNNKGMVGGVTYNVDIINAPDPTPLCRAARLRGCRTQGGRPMHEGQAVHALRFLGFDYVPEGKSAPDIGVLSVPAKDAGP